MGLSLAKRFSLLPREVQQEWLTSLPEQALEEVSRKEWWWTARPEQIAPDGDWHILLFLAGRGTGKTRSGAEWLIQRVLDYPVDRSGSPTEHLVVADSLSDARALCVEGPSGLLRILERRGFIQITNSFHKLGPYDFRYTKSPKPKIEIGQYGARIYFEGADKSDVGRGYNTASAWLDEIIKWDNPKDAWIQGIMPSIRADIPGDHPRVFITTTPKPLDLLYELVARDDGSVHVVRGSTYDNADNLSEHMLEEFRRQYEGTSIGRQELHGELLDMIEGALFRMTDINRNRVDELPDDITHIGVGVDPSLTGEEAEMGCVVVARTRDSHLYVIADETIEGTGREAIDHCWKVFETYEADILVYEDTQGKEYLTQVMRDSFTELRREGYFANYIVPPMKSIDSKRGKKLRAQPVALRTEQGRVHMVGTFELLEKQMVQWIPEETARSHRNSPDRLDALVHICWQLMKYDKRSVRFGSAANMDQPLVIPRVQLPQTGRLTVVRR